MSRTGAAEVVVFLFRSPFVNQQFHSRLARSIIFIAFEDKFAVNGSQWPD